MVDVEGNPQDPVRELDQLFRADARQTGHHGDSGRHLDDDPDLAWHQFRNEVLARLLHHLEGTLERSTLRRRCHDLRRPCLDRGRLHHE